ncbi:lysophospholipid acyltransferase family protein [Rhodoferax sp.]|uniref:lysophospholipid acyltransferase family protein n=1 Tax=Rhodoferax sp. TaxID=50421 RepID=UPI002849B4E5|nr:lysophospholipid acyltransferase family protein [Rhodoferax sp.]MDR3370035.1 lysophospholipid acyltransferase family protein [Rhodoferax sp.]
MTAFFRFLSVLPLAMLQGLGWLLGWAVFATSGVYRRRFLDNVHQAGIGMRDWLSAVGESGKLVSELPRLWLGRPVPVLWDGAPHVESALALGRGVVFLTPHMGCFEVTAQAYAQRYGQTGKPMTVLFRPPRQAWLRAVVNASRQRPGMLTAPTTLSGVKQLIKALKKGECVGLLPDQVPPQGMGVMVPFFGRDAYTMTLSARLVQQTGATVLLAWGERLGWGRGYRVHVQPMQASLPLDLTLAATAVNQAMQDLIRQCPGQYLWGYARYKPPQATAHES